MGLLFPTRRTGPLIRAESSKEYMVRMLLVVCIFGGCGYLFWISSGNALKRIEARSSVYDPADQLTAEEARGLREFAVMFKNEFGVEVKVHFLKDEPVELPDLDSKTLFIGVNTTTGKALVDFPPLVRRALGDDFMYWVQNEHFASIGENRDWAKHMALALKFVWDRLVGEAEAAASPVPKDAPEVRGKIQK